MNGENSQTVREDGELSTFSDSSEIHNDLNPCGSVLSLSDISSIDSFDNVSGFRNEAIESHPRKHRTSRKKKLAQMLSTKSKEQLLEELLTIKCKKRKSKKKSKGIKKRKKRSHIQSIADQELGIYEARTFNKVDDADCIVSNDECDTDQLFPSLLENRSVDETTDLQNEIPITFKNPNHSNVEVSDIGESNIELLERSHRFLESPTSPESSSSYRKSSELSKLNLGRTKSTKSRRSKHFKSHHSENRSTYLNKDKNIFPCENNHSRSCFKKDHYYQHRSVSPTQRYRTGEYSTGSRSPPPHPSRDRNISPTQRYRTGDYSTGSRSPPPHPSRDRNISPTQRYRTGDYSTGSRSPPPHTSRDRSVSPTQRYRTGDYSTGSRSPPPHPSRDRSVSPTERYSYTDQSIRSKSPPEKYRSRKRNRSPCESYPRDERVKRRSPLQQYRSRDQSRSPQSYERRRKNSRKMTSSSPHFKCPCDGYDCVRSSHSEFRNSRHRTHGRNSRRSQSSSTSSIELISTLPQSDTSSDPSFIKWSSTNNKSESTRAENDKCQPMVANRIENIVKDLSNIQNPSTESSHSKIPSTESSQSKIPSTESRQSKIPSSESSQSKIPFTESSQSEIPSTESSHSKIPSTDSSQSKNPSTESSQSKIPSTDISHSETLSTKTRCNETFPTSANPVQCPKIGPTCMVLNSFAQESAIKKYSNPIDDDKVCLFNSNTIEVDPNKNQCQSAISVTDPYPSNQITSSVEQILSSVSTSAPFGPEITFAENNHQNDNVLNTCSPAQEYEEADNISNYDVISMDSGSTCETHSSNQNQMSAIVEKSGDILGSEMSRNSCDDIENWAQAIPVIEGNRCTNKGDNEVRNRENILREVFVHEMNPGFIFRDPSMPDFVANGSADFFSELQHVLCSAAFNQNIKSDKLNIEKWFAIINSIYYDLIYSKNYSTLNMVVKYSHIMNLILSHFRYCAEHHKGIYSNDFPMYISKLEAIQTWLNCDPHKNQFISVVDEHEVTFFEKNSNKIKKFLLQYQLGISSTKKVAHEKTETITSPSYEHDILEVSNKKTFVDIFEVTNKIDEMHMMIEDPKCYEMFEKISLKTLESLLNFVERDLDSDTEKYSHKCKELINEKKKIMGWKEYVQKTFKETVLNDGPSSPGQIEFLRCIKQTLKSWKSTYDLLEKIDHIINKYELSGQAKKNNISVPKDKSESVDNITLSILPIDCANECTIIPSENIVVNKAARGGNATDLKKKNENIEQIKINMDSSSVTRDPRLRRKSDSCDTVKNVEKSFETFDSSKLRKWAVEKPCLQYRSQFELYCKKGAFPVDPRLEAYRQKLENEMSNSESVDSSKMANDLGKEISKSLLNVDPMRPVRGINAHKDPRVRKKEALEITWKKDDNIKEMEKNYPSVGHSWSRIPLRTENINKQCTPNEKSKIETANIESLNDSVWTTTLLSSKNVNNHLNLKTPRVDGKSTFFKKTDDRTQLSKKELVNPTLNVQSTANTKCYRKFKIPFKTKPMSDLIKGNVRDPISCPNRNNKKSSVDKKSQSNPDVKLLLNEICEKVSASNCEMNRDLESKYSLITGDIKPSLADNSNAANSRDNVSKRIETNERKKCSSMVKNKNILSEKLSKIRGDNFKSKQSNGVTDVISVSTKHPTSVKPNLKSIDIFRDKKTSLTKNILISGIPNVHSKMNINKDSSQKGCERKLTVDCKNNIKAKTVKTHSAGIKCSKNLIPPKGSKSLNSSLPINAINTKAKSYESEILERRKEKQLKQINRNKVKNIKNIEHVILNTPYLKPFRNDKKLFECRVLTNKVKYTGNKGKHLISPDECVEVNLTENIEKPTMNTIMLSRDKQKNSSFEFCRDVVKATEYIDKNEVGPKKIVINNLKSIESTEKVLPVSSKEDIKGVMTSTGINHKSITDISSSEFDKIVNMVSCSETDEKLINSVELNRTKSSSMENNGEEITEINDKADTVPNPRLTAMEVITNTVKPNDAEVSLKCQSSKPHIPNFRNAWDRMKRVAARYKEQIGNSRPSLLKDIGMETIDAPKLLQSTNTNNQESHLPEKDKAESISVRRYSLDSNFPNNETKNILPLKINLKRCSEDKWVKVNNTTVNEDMTKVQSQNSSVKIAVDNKRTEFSSTSGTNKSPTKPCHNTKIDSPQYQRLALSEISIKESHGGKEDTDTFPCDNVLDKPKGYGPHPKSMKLKTLTDIDEEKKYKNSKCNDNFASSKPSDVNILDEPDDLFIDCTIKEEFEVTILNRQSTGKNIRKTSPRKFKKENFIKEN